MKPFRSASLAILIASPLVLGLGACSSGDPEASRSLGAAPGGESSALLRSVLTDPDLPGCSAAVARNGDVVWADAFGTNNLADGVPLTVDTPFEIGSVSKHVTGIAILVLVEDGLVDLDASVATYLPDAGPWAESMTVEQLLHHTSGLADYIGLFLAMGEDMPDPVDTDEVLGVLLNVPATESPVPWVYSTSNYVVLARIVEVVAGQSFPDFVEERLFAPQGSSLMVEPAATYPAIATRYGARNADAPEMANSWQAYGDSSVVATPSALARWFDVLRTGLDEYPTLGDDMIANAALITAESGNTYGAGVTITPDGRIWHSGYKPGQISYLTMSPDRSTTLAISCNADELDPEITFLESEFERIWFTAG